MGISVSPIPSLFGKLRIALVGERGRELREFNAGLAFRQRASQSRWDAGRQLRTERKPRGRAAHHRPSSRGRLVGTQ